MGEHPSLRLLYVVPVLLVAVVLTASASLGGKPAKAATPPSPTSRSGVGAAPSGSPSVDPSVSPAGAPGSATPAATPAAQAPLAASRPRGVTAAQATTSLDSFDRVFYVVQSDRGYFRRSAGSSTYAPFWRTAEMIEMVEDAAQLSGSSTYRRMVGQLTRGVTHRFGTCWTRNRIYNDDVMWMVLAFERASSITGSTSLRTIARSNFDATYARGWSGAFGGGIWWTTDKDEKNACVNAPAALAALGLSQSLHQKSYLTKAEQLFGWVRSHLYNAGTGAVYDHLSSSGGQTAVDRDTYTYNQGTFAGAARRLSSATGDGSYQSEAHDALEYAKDQMTTPDGILRAEGDGGDGGGFKGVLVRYAGDYDRHDSTHEYHDWLSHNGDVAWSDRDDQGLIGEDWTRQTDATGMAAFDASSAVVLLQQLR